jgi:hypothetical protein
MQTPEEALRASIFEEYANTNVIVDAENVHTVEWPRNYGPFTVDNFRKLWAHYRRNMNTHEEPRVLHPRHPHFNQYEAYKGAGAGAGVGAGVGAGADGQAIPHLTAEELSWYDRANLSSIFNMFLTHDTPDYLGGLFLAFCLESGDEIILQRVVQVGQQGRVGAEVGAAKKGFRIIFAEYSREVNSSRESRNQLPKDDDVERISIMTNKFGATNAVVI